MIFLRSCCFIITFASFWFEGLPLTPQSSSRDAWYMIVAGIAAREVSWSPTSTIGFLPGAIKQKALRSFQHSLGSRTLEELSVDPIRYGETKDGLWSLPMHDWLVHDQNGSMATLGACRPGIPCLPRSILNFTALLYNQLSTSRSGDTSTVIRPSAPSPLAFVSFLVASIHSPAHVSSSQQTKF